jgi:opacity protein-like surface antigen
MRNLAAIAAAVALASAAPGAARAQPFSEPSGPSTYLEAHGGTWIPQDDDLDAFDAGFDFGATLGARFSRYLGAEGELSWTRATGYAGAAYLTIHTLPITASVRASLPFKRAEIHALTGVGLHMTGLSGEWSAAGYPVGGSEWQVALGWHVGAGVGFQLWPTIRVGAEVRRTFANAGFDGFDLRIDGLRAAITLAHDL